MSAPRYKTGQPVKAGDAISYNGQKGRIKAIGDALLEWGKTKKEVEEGFIMVEFDNGALLSTKAGDNHLALIAGTK